MTSFEKKMIAAVVVCMFGIVVFAHMLARQIENAGGLKGVAVEAGKAVIEIKKEIARDDGEIYPFVNGKALNRNYYKCEFGVLVRTGSNEPVLDIDGKRIACELLEAE